MTSDFSKREEPYSSSYEDSYSFSVREVPSRNQPGRSRFRSVIETPAKV